MYLSGVKPQESGVLTHSWKSQPQTHLHKINCCSKQILGSKGWQGRCMFFKTEGLEDCWGDCGFSRNGIDWKGLFSKRKKRKHSQAPPCQPNTQSSEGRMTLLLSGEGGSLPGADSAWAPPPQPLPAQQQTIWATPQNHSWRVFTCCICEVETGATWKAHAGNVL